MSLIFKLLSVLALANSVLSAPCDGKTSGTDVVGGIEYNCVSAGHEAIGCFANGASQEIGATWKGEPLEQNPFEWKCMRVDADTVAYNVIACFLPNDGARMEIGDSVTMDNIGTYSCVMEAGQVTRKFEGPMECVYKGNTYANDQIIIIANGELKCVVNSGGAGVKAVACVSGDVRAAVGKIAEVSGVASKCLAEGENKDELNFVALEVSDCNGHAIGDKWVEGDINKQCIVKGLKAVTEDYSCNRDGVEFKGIRKFGDGDFSQCVLCGIDCTGSKINQVADTACDNGQELLATYVVGDVKFKCKFTADKAVEDPIACLSGDQEIIEGTNIELGSAANTGFRCELNAMDALVLRPLSDEEYTAWKSSGGSTDGNNGELSGDGGEGTGELETTMEKSASTPAATSPAPSSPAPINEATTTKAPSPPTTTKRAPSTDSPTTRAPATDAPTSVAPLTSAACADKYSDCPVVFKYGCTPLAFLMALKFNARSKRYAQPINTNLYQWKTSVYGGSGISDLSTGYKAIYGGYNGAPAPAPVPYSRYASYNSYQNYLKYKKPTPAPIATTTAAPAINFSSDLYKLYEEGCPATCGRC